MPTVLAIAAGASLCGMRGCKAITGWARSLGPKARARFGCRCDKQGGASFHVNTSFATFSCGPIRWRSTGFTPKPSWGARESPPPVNGCREVEQICPGLTQVEAVWVSRMVPLRRI
jgi:hypothetical protein